MGFKPEGSYLCFRLAHESPQLPSADEKSFLRCSVDFFNWRPNTVAADQISVPCSRHQALDRRSDWQSRWPSSGDVPQAVVRHPVLLSEWWEHTSIFRIAVKANILSCLVYSHITSQIAEQLRRRKDVAELEFFSQVFNGCEEGGKSHSCDFFQLQVSLAENSTQRRTSKTLFHTVFQLNSSLYVLGFEIEFVRLWGSQKMKTNLSFQLGYRTDLTTRQHLKHSRSSSTGNEPLPRRNNVLNHQTSQTPFNVKNRGD